MLNCPICSAEVIENQCQSGHSFEEENGVLKLMTPDFAQKVGGFLEKFEAVRAQQGFSGIDPQQFPRLPECGQGKEWSYRCQDLQRIKALITKPKMKILEIGAWIGWLANRLAEDGHEVTAVGYFSHELDGLAAKKYYDTSWKAIQMDLECMPFQVHAFDLVIFNRCLQYFKNPLYSFDDACSKVKPGGRVISSGMYFYKDHQGQEKTRQQHEQFEYHYAFKPQFVPVKSYLNHEDLSRLKASGVQFQRYEGHGRTWIKKHLTSKPQHLFGYLDVHE